MSIVNITLGDIFLLAAGSEQSTKLKDILTSSSTLRYRVRMFTLNGEERNLNNISRFRLYKI
jgi:hypothetical protein